MSDGDERELFLFPLSCPNRRRLSCRQEESTEREDSASTVPHARAFVRSLAKAYSDRSCWCECLWVLLSRQNGFFLHSVRVAGLLPQHAPHVPQVSETLTSLCAKPL